MRSKYLQVIGRKSNSRAIYNLAIAVSIKMRPYENSAYLEIIYDIENAKKNVKVAYSFTEEGMEDLYHSHALKITYLMETDDEFLTLEFPQL
jgi:hypothetical protein